MSRVKRITISNLKALSDIVVDFNGCTVIVTGGNNKGKTSLLRSLPDRIRGSQPDAILKEGTEAGFSRWELTTGEKLVWEFSEKKDKLTYITEKEVKASMTMEIREKFFPKSFDVDKFLADQPMKQRKTLQELVGLDFTDIDKRYDEAYKERETLNRVLNENKIQFEKMEVPAKYERVHIELLNNEKQEEKNRLNKIYVENKAANAALRTAYESEKSKVQSAINVWGLNQQTKQFKLDSCNKILASLRMEGYTGNEVVFWISNLPQPEIEHSYKMPDEPSYVEEMPSRETLDSIEARINDAIKNNEYAARYETWLMYKTDLEKHRKNAADAEVKVQAVQTERMNLIKSAVMPEGFTFSDTGILYNGLAFTREQQSSSGLYIAALKLAAMTLGEVRCLHFDASFLDRDNLNKIEKWAEENDLQLLIERPDFEGGEISYEIIETL